MKLLLLTALFSVTFTSLFAQKPDSTKAGSVRPSNPNARRNGYETNMPVGQIVGSGPYTMINTIDHRYEGVQGSPYFLPEWNKGQIEMAAGQNHRDVSIKFDAHRQQLILLRTWAGNDSIIIKADQVKSFQFQTNDGQLYVFRRFPTAKTDDESVKEGYFLVLYQGKSALLKRIAKTFRKADYKGAYSNDIRYDEYRPAFSYYLLKPDQTLTKVKLSDKALIESLGDHKDELKAFVKQENLTFKNEDDAIQLVKKYDTL